MKKSVKRAGDAWEQSTRLYLEAESVSRPRLLFSVQSMRFDPS